MSQGKKPKENKEMTYDKIRYPGYKELVYRKIHQELLPKQPHQIPKIIGSGGPIDMNLGGN